MSRLIIILTILLSSTLAKSECNGKFLNPITDICWSCVFPITIGGIELAKSEHFKDTENPISPVCACKKDGAIVPTPGITIGFWEPIRVVEVVRDPYCLVSLGGLSVGDGLEKGGYKHTRETSGKSSKAYYHIHYYVYPLIAVLNLVSDLGCMDISSFDLAYMSELDPSHSSDKLSSLLNPEVFLLNNVIAHSACSAECVYTSASGKPLDYLFWCSGCQGSMYPIQGHTANHIGGVQTSSLLAARMLAKLHKSGLARKTTTNSIGSELCHGSYTPRLPKSQYRLQMTYPRANVSGKYSCNPIGMFDGFFSSGREFPYLGEDFVYMIWRKRNCCFL